jgi:hypothetical protein
MKKMKNNLLPMLILLTVIFSQSSNASIVGMIAGDSYSNDRGDWPKFVENAELYTTAIGGQRLVDMPKNFGTNLDRHVQEYGINTAIIQGGINDIARGNDTLAGMQDAVIEMVTAAEQRNLDVIIFNIAPWSTASSQVKRDEIEVYNDWLLGYTDQQEINLIDMYATVVDKNDPQKLKQEFDLDGLHLNEAGKIAVAAAFDSEISQVPEVPAAVPVPGAVWLFATGLIGLITRRRLV